jgi:hypothetical protein
VVRVCVWTGLIGFDGARTGRRDVRALGVLAILGLTLVLVSAADASTNFTWSGNANAPVPEWSEATNWTPETAPISGEEIEALSFPALAGKGLSCTFTTPNGGCGYGSENNVSNLTAESMNIDDGEDYSIIGKPITLGAGGLFASPTTSTSTLTISELDLPIVLDASQAWNIGDQGAQNLFENDLYLEGSLTGSGALTVTLNDGPALYVENKTEVGPVVIDGANASGEHIENGALFLGDGELNSSDREPVDLSNIFFSGAGTIGALSADNSTLHVGYETDPAEGIRASSVKLGANAAVLFNIVSSGTTAQADYSQLVSEGPLELGGVVGVVVSKPTKTASCPVLVPGATYTLLSTTGNLSGTFANAPEGGPEITVYFSEECSHPSQSMRIGYDRNGSTETVTGTVEAKAKEEKERDEEGIRKGSEALKIIAEREARERAERAVAEQKVREEAGRLPSSAAVTGALQIPTRTPLDEGGSVSLDGSAITVQSSGEAAVKLACAGTTKCTGKLTLTANGTKADRLRRDEKAKTKIIGVADFSIAAGKTTTIKLTLNTIGQALLSGDHGRLSASLMVLKSAPAPSQTHTDSVHLAQQKPHGDASSNARRATGRH